MAISYITGGVAAIVCLFVAFRHFHKKRLVDDLPTSRALGAFIGLVELKGTAESEAPLTSRLASIPCVAYTWRVEEHWSRTVTETYRDAQGRTQTRTRHESGWRMMANGGEAAPFYLKDETGVIRIQPDGAKIEDIEAFDRTVTPADPLYYGKGPAHETANSDHRRRFRETAIPLHAPLYVMGQARERQDAVAAEVAKDKGAPLFLISIRTEKQVSRGYGVWVWAFAGLGLVAADGGVFIGGLISGTRAGGGVYAVASGAFVLAAALGWTWTVYNSLVGLRQSVRQAWAQVDIQLKRRHDLIPALTQVAAATRTHERDVETIIAALRGQSVAPGAALRGVTPTLRALVESYPDLRSSESFLRLQQSLADTEQRIALARDYYNNIASFYNARLEIVPDRFVGALAGFRQQPLAGAEALERAPVTVRLVS